MRLVLVGSVIMMTGWCLPISVEAQYLDSRTLSWSRTDNLPVAPAQLAQPGDYRTQYAIVGAVFLGAVGGWALHEACKSQPVAIEPRGDRGCDGVTVAGAAVGAALGGGLGYVVGRLTHKR